MPSDSFIEILLEHDVEFTIESDTYGPSEVGEWNTSLDEFITDSIDLRDPRAVPEASD